jgi:uncharacterized membrane protein YesL
MKQLFSYDSPVSQALFKFCWACCLGAVWLVCSLPVFTLGASTTALYAVTIKLVRDRESTSPLRQFFAAFRSNFKQATILWLMLLTVGVFLALDVYILSHLRSTTAGAPAVVWTLLFAVVLAASLIYVIILLYTFPLLSCFENNNRAMLLNAFLVGVRYLFCTILMLALHAVVAWVTINLFPPLFAFGEGLCALGSSYLLSNVFYALSGEEREPPEEADPEKETL